MRKKILLIGGLILFFVLFYSFIYHPYPSINENDFNMNASLKVNNVPGTNEEKYVLEINFTKSKSGQNIIYTYMPGFSTASIYVSQNNTPLNGRASIDKFSKNLANEKIMEILNNKNIHDQLAAYGIARGKGNYYGKLFYADYNVIDPMGNFYIVVVHIEKTLLKDLSWVKVIKIENNLIID